VRSWAAGANDTIVDFSGVPPFVQHPGVTGDITALAFYDGDHGWFADSSGVVRRYVSGGIWSQESIEVTVSAISAVGPSTAWLAGHDEDDGVVMLTASGDSWTPKLTTTRSAINDVAGPTADECFAVTANGAVYHTVDGGAHWDAKSVASSTPLCGVSVVMATVVAVGDNGTIARSTDNGVTYHTTSLGGYRFRDVSFSGDYGAVVGDGGVVFETSDGGVTWAKHDAGTTRDLYAVDITRAGAVRIVGAGGTALLKLSLPTAGEICGPNRYATSAALSEKTFTPGETTTVVIARGDTWPDALGGASLAGAVNGPILLTQPGSLATSVGAEIQRLGASKAYVLGGSLTEAVVTQIKSKLVAPKTVVRVAGSNRYATSAAIATETVAELGRRREEYSGRAFVTTGLKYPDALAAAPGAAWYKEPILLVDPAVGASAVIVGAARVIETTHFVALGDASTLSTATLDSLQTTIGATSYERWAGKNRYGTAAAIAEGITAHRPLPGAFVSLATGGGFADALAGGAAEGHRGGVLLLTGNDALAPEAAQWLVGKSFDDLRFLGGKTSLALRPRDEAMWVLTSGY
jgi:photosystem II stability/assembly factor-like uncharacterized protein/putative cell wall-binding protein